MDSSNGTIPHTASTWLDSQTCAGLVEHVGMRCKEEEADTVLGAVVTDIHNPWSVCLVSHESAVELNETSKKKHTVVISMPRSRVIAIALPR